MVEVHLVMVLVVAVPVQAAVATVTAAKAFSPVAAAAEDNTLFSKLQFSTHRHTLVSFQRLNTTSIQLQSLKLQSRTIASLIY